MKLEVLHEDLGLEVLKDFLTGQELPLYPEISVRPDGISQLSVQSPEDWTIASVTMHGAEAHLYSPTIIGNLTVDLHEPDSLEKIYGILVDAYTKKKKRSYGRTRIPRHGY